MTEARPGAAGRTARFVDAHVHLRDPAGLADALAAGVTALRDAGTKDGRGLRAASSDRPQVISAGWALVRMGGYGTVFGKAVGSHEEIKAEIRKLGSAGAGIIKVVASGMVSLKDPGAITPGGFGPDDLRFIVEEAAQLGLGVMAHANGEEAIGNAAAARVLSIEHGFFMTNEALQVMHKNGVFWVPTIAALQRAAETPGASSAARAFVNVTIQRHIEMVGKAFHAGVRLAIGTDCVLPDPHYGEFFEVELACFRRAGIPEEDVIRIASRVGKELLHV